VTYNQYDRRQAASGTFAWLSGARCPMALRHVRVCTISWAGLTLWYRDIGLSI